MSEYSDEAIDQPACSDQHLAEFDPKQQQPQTTAEDLTSVMHELRQRFDNRVNQNPVPAQSVQKEEQKEQLNYRQRKYAYLKKRKGLTKGSRHSVKSLFLFRWPRFLGRERASPSQRQEETSNA